MTIFIIWELFCLIIWRRKFWKFTLNWKLILILKKVFPELYKFKSFLEKRIETFFWEEKLLLFIQMIVSIRLNFSWRAWQRRLKFLKDLVLDLKSFLEEMWILFLKLGLNPRRLKVLVIISVERPRKSYGNDEFKVHDRSLFKIKYELG